MKRLRSVRIPPAVYFSTAGLVTGVSAWLYCAMLGVGTAPMVTGVLVGVWYAVFYAHDTEVNGP